MTQAVDTPVAASTERSMSPQEYAAFIDQIELRSIWIENVTLTNHHGPEAPERGAIASTSRASYTPRSSGFCAHHHYTVTLEGMDIRYLDLEVVFGLEFSSGSEMTDAVFDVFQNVNLPVNTWPYLREFVSNMMGRMGWEPYTLPAIKRGTESASRPANKGKKGPTPTSGRGRRKAKAE